MFPLEPETPFSIKGRFVKARKQAVAAKRNVIL